MHYAAIGKSEPLHKMKKLCLIESQTQRGSMLIYQIVLLSCRRKRTANNTLIDLKYNFRSRVYRPLLQLAKSVHSIVS